MSLNGWVCPYFKIGLKHPSIFVSDDFPSLSNLFRCYFYTPKYTLTEMEKKKLHRRKHKSLVT